MGKDSPWRFAARINQILGILDMDEKKIADQETVQEERRAFLKKAGTIAVAAPAAALLLSAKSKSAQALHVSAPR
jgi:hypothetical protein